MIRSGMRPPSPKTGTGFSAAMCCGSSWKGFWIAQGSSPYCRTSISRSTARSSRPGPRTRASRDGSDDGDGSNFHGQRRKNDTHQSTSDPQAKLYRKAAGREAKLCYMGHAVMENRNGLAVDGTVTQAGGTAERRASEAMLKKKAKRSGRRITVGEDKAYDTSDHVAALREMNITPHVAQNDSLTKTGKHRSSAIDGRTTRHIGYRISQSCRAMSECIFGWGKQHGTMRKTKHRGIWGSSPSRRKKSLRQYLKADNGSSDEKI